MRIKNLELRIKHKKLYSIFLQLNSNALTLIEVLIAMGIAVVAGVLLLVIIVNSAGMFTKQSAKVESGLSSNDALLEMRKSIKLASAISDQSSSNQLVLKVLSVDATGNIIDNTYDDFIFLVDTNFLRFKIFPDTLSTRQAADQVLSKGVDDLSFQYFNSANPPLEVTPASAAKVRITLTLKQKAGADFENNTATSEADLRND